MTKSEKAVLAIVLLSVFAIGGGVGRALADCPTVKVAPKICEGYCRDAGWNEPGDCPEPSCPSPCADPCPSPCPQERAPGSPCDPEIRVEPIATSCQCPWDVAGECPVPLVCFDAMGNRIEQAEPPVLTGVRPTYRLDLLLTAHDDGHRAGLVWNRWKRFRPVVEAVYRNPDRATGESCYRGGIVCVDRTVDPPDGWTVGAGVAIGLWKRR